MVFFHADTGAGLRYIARYITSVHLRVLGIAEHAVDSLAQGDSPYDP